MYMYKMKDVCQMTGLTEKAVRLYMEQKLICPRMEEGVHRKAYYFSENDIERLKDIAALRSAGFALADIKMMLEDPANISRLVEEKEALLAMEIEQKRSVQEVLNHLTIEEHINLYIEDGKSSMDAIKIVAKERGMKKSEVYDIYHNIEKK